MENPGVPEQLWAALNGGLWHATSLAGLRGIIAAREIRIIGARYHGSFCRSKMAVSLIDFGDAASPSKMQWNNVLGWFGQQQGSRVAVWLEIDRSDVSDYLLDSFVARELWLSCPSSTFIPGLEACHCGPIPMAAIPNLVLIDGHDRANFRICGPDSLSWIGQLADFESALPSPRPTPGLFAAVQRARERLKRF